MPIQLSRPLVFFDLETTGVDVKEARIVEISVAKHLDDPDKLDLEGNLVLVNGKPHLNFGKHLGKSLEWVANKDPDYLNWLLNGTFLSDTKAIVERYVGVDFLQ
jgi:DNA polymerase III epsilon subunit-like protein